MSTTIRDIARAAGVSTGTVSRALKEQRGLSDATRRHVREIACALGYDLDRLRDAPVQRIACVLHRQHGSLTDRPLQAQLLQGIEDACQQAGAVPTLLTVQTADTVVALARRHAPDRLLVAGYVPPELLDALDRLARPMVLADLRAAGRVSVNAEDAEGGRLATWHLARVGRRRIACVAEALPHPGTQARQLGYRRALHEAGLPADPDLDLATSGQTADVAMRRLLRRPQRPDAVFACDDLSALAALQVCLEAGLRVPQDIAFVGFGDIAAAALAPVPLTTLRVDGELLGRLAVELLLQTPAATETLEIPVTLVTRASTGDAA
jgi:DNA-binding LacI/PurR family transcriptional regulator